MVSWLEATPTRATRHFESVKSVVEIDFFSVISATRFYYRLAKILLIL
jgi:hypothetical protein